MKASLSANDFYNTLKSADQNKISIFDKDKLLEEDEDEIKEKKTKVERPITPVDQAMKKPPKSDEQLTSCFIERLRISADLDTVSSEDQTELANVLIRSIVAAWPEHRRQSADPFLNFEGNKELERRVAVFVVTSCEELFYNAIQTLEEMNKKIVFSVDANLSRMETQLASQANKSLNILDIRRKIAEEMRKLPDEAWFKSDESSMSSVENGPTYVRAMTEKARSDFLHREMQELSHQMPVLPEFNRNIVFKPNSQKFQPVEEEADDDVEQPEEQDTPKESPVARQQSLVERTEIEKAFSLPVEYVDIDAFDEFTKAKDAAFGRTGSHVMDIGDCDAISIVEQQKAATPREDLRNLLNAQAQVEVGADVEASGEDLHPLLQAAPLFVSNRVALQQKVVDLEAERAGEAEDTESIASTVDTFCAESKHLIKEDEVKDPPIQPGTVSFKTPKGVMRISDVRVSNRINESVITLEMYPTVYNEFLGEISDEKVKEMDRNLFYGDEIKEVYDEIIKTMSKDYLRYDQDPIVQLPAPALPTDVDYFMSSVLKRKDPAMRDVRNTDISTRKQAPWNENASRNEWKNEPLFNGLGREDMLRVNSQHDKGRIQSTLQARSVSPLCSGMATNQKAFNFQLTYSAWLQWYQSIVNFPDYLKFLDNTENDYLGQMFHLYDSADDDKDGENAERRAAEVLKLKQRRKKRGEVRSQKAAFESGFWNAQSVTLGGLGQDPELEDDGDPNVEVTDLDINSEAFLSLQERLEKIWSQLRAPEAERLDMALKYSSDDAIDKLAKVIEVWEEATQFIVEREMLISKLEKFEMTASDPNRFFEKGVRGTSLSRITESTIREKLNKSIKKTQEDLAPVLKKLKKRYGDIVTFMGRPYEQKMQCDRVEMLYWLQQERRQKTLNAGGASEQTDRTQSRDSSATTRLSIVQLAAESLVPSVS